MLQTQWIGLGVAAAVVVASCIRMAYEKELFLELGIWLRRLRRKYGRPKM